MTFAAGNSSDGSDSKTPGVAAPAIPGTLDTSQDQDTEHEREPREQVFNKIKFRSMRGTTRRGASARPPYKSPTSSLGGTPATSVTRSGSMAVGTGSAARSGSRMKATINKDGLVKKKERGVSIPPVLKGDPEQVLNKLIRDAEKAKDLVSQVCGGGW